jgi:hypothetical protein
LKGEDKSMRCAICGRKLTNEVSIQRGIGPICYSHILEECGKIPVAHAKYYTPDSNWTWYILEGEGKYRYPP